MPSRRTLLALALAGSTAVTWLTGCATSAPSSTERPPIVFMHGNGDSAALWQTTIWRFESNGWPRERLFAVDQPNPLARDDDAVAQPGRSSTTESAAFLRAEVEKVLKATGAPKVVLIGNSRGGNTIRNYVQNGGGAAVVSHVVLGGNPAHGIWKVKGLRENNEFSGLSAFMQQLNAPKGPNGDEVTPGVQWLTLRSDTNDKYAQPDGLWIGAPGQPTNIGFDGPALKGATNLVLPRVDHRETSFSPSAFAATWRFLTGHAPASTAVAPESKVVLDGRATGADNLALAGARVT
ncbi:esterase/lipase family protein, partial [Variovorax boronicumulans]|uniref:esterase/lipase family protein n=1 Tax=Variovorax boronicumulans TaxID=436515 RepID=UPI000A9651F2